LRSTFFFLDRSLGSKQLPGILEGHGFAIRVHDKYFDRDEVDEVWLASCGQRKWIVITPDKNILKDPVSMRAIGANKGRVFFLSKNNKSPTLWAPILISCWAELKRVISTRKAPFVGNISPNGVWRIRELNSQGRDRKKGKKS
jgi:hypothetical protein